MKRILLILVAAVALFASQARAQEPEGIVGTWRLMTMESSENGQSTGVMYINRIYLTFEDNGICINPSKIEREYTYDKENAIITIGNRKASVVSLTENELVWDEATGNTVIRYSLKREPAPAGQ